jgi:hypothetical protein
MMFRYIWFEKPFLDKKGKIPSPITQHFLQLYGILFMH